MTWDPVAPLRGRPPDVTLEEAPAVASRFFGVEGSFSRLVSERDKNFLVEEPDGTRFVLKIHNTADGPTLVEMQTQALLHIAAADPSIPIQRVNPTLGGDPYVLLKRPDGSTHIVRMLTYVPGKRVQAGDLSLRAIEGFGASAAGVARALQNFSHPGAQRPLLWDIKQGAALRPLLVHIADPERRDLADHWLSRFEEEVLPGWIGTLRTQVIHNDLTLDNVLFAEDGSVSGVVDFGDAVQTALVCDLAMLLASLIGDRADPFEVATAAIRGYHSVTRLGRDELHVLADLIAMRAVANVAVSAWRTQLYPDNAAYISSWDAGSWVILQTFRETGIHEVRRAFATTAYPHRGQGNP
ncbi:MAG: phosphotransferase [Actinomycetota bacterium]|nr:phosphotransferase [Actinomycetota bacterium]